MSSLVMESRSARDRGRSALVGARFAGRVAAAVVLFGATLVVAALTRSGAIGPALFAAAVAAFGVLWIPQRLLAATRQAVTGRAVVDGMRSAGRALAPAVFAALAALAAANLVAAVGTETAPTVTTSTYLWAVVAVLVAGVGLLVGFPGAWLLSGRPGAGATRSAWPALLVAGLALAYPGAYLLFEGVTARLPAAPGLGWDALALALLGAVSAGGAALSSALLPRPVAAIAMDPRGRHALVARRGGARLVDVDSGEVEAQFVEGASAVAMAPGGALMALAGPGDEIALRRVADGALVRRLSGAPRGVAALAFDRDADRLAAVGDPAWVAVWDLAAPGDGPERHPTRMAYGRSVAFDPTGETLRVAIAAGAVTELSLTSGKPPRGPLRPAVGASRATLSPDGQDIVCATGTAPVWDQASALRIRDGLTPRWTRGVGETIRAVAIGAGGAVAVASLDGGLRVFDATGQPLGELAIGEGATALAVDAGGSRVVVGGRWTVARCDVASGAVVRLEVRAAEAALAAGAPAR